MKIRAALLGLFLAVACAFGGPESSSVKVVFLRVKDDAAGYTQVGAGMGTGTVIASKGGRSLVLTCRHVVPDPDGTILVKAGASTYGAELLAVDDAADLAVLRVRAELPAVAVADVGPADGADLRQWGYTKGGPMNPKHGPAREHTNGKVDGKPFDVRVTGIAPDFGDSGSGVFDADGRVVGVCAAKAEGKAGTVGLLVPLADVRRFLAGRAP
jgi:S1-C subfamily serine protease